MKHFTTQYLRSVLLYSCLVLSACNNKTDEKTKAEKENQKIFTTIKEETDAQFIVNATDLLLLQIKLSKLAGQNSIKPEIQKLSKEIEDVHIKQLYEIRNIAAKKGISIPTSISKKEEAYYDKISYEIAEDFEVIYFDELVKNYKNMIPKFERSTNSKDEEIRLWSIKTIPVLRKNLGMALINQAASHKAKSLKIK